MPPLDETEARRRFGAARAAHLATVRPSGAPHVAVIAFALSGDRIYTAVDQKPKRSADLQRLRNVSANPSASVLVDVYDEDWSRLWWVRVDGSAAIVEMGPELARGHEALRTKYPHYRGADLGTLIVIRVARWTSWAARG